MQRSLTTPEDEGSGIEVQNIATQRSNVHEVNKSGVRPDIRVSLSQFHQRLTNVHYIKRRSQPVERHQAFVLVPSDPNTGLPCTAPWKRQ